MDRVGAVDSGFISQRCTSKGLMGWSIDGKISRVAVIFSSVIGCRVDAVTGNEQQFLSCCQEGSESVWIINRNPVVSKVVGEFRVVDHVKWHRMIFPWLCSIGFQDNGLHSFIHTGFENADCLKVVGGIPDGSLVGPNRVEFIHLLPKPFNRGWW